MAGFLLPAEGVSSTNNVKEMSFNGEDPLPQFIVQESPFGSVNCSLPMVEIPVIDMSLLSSEDELDKMISAFTSWGCFQAIGHGISSSFLDKVRDLGKKFFSLPLEEKQKCFRIAGEGEGFGSDVVVSEKQTLDWSNRLFLMVLPKDRRRLNLWPENPKDFGEIIIDYTMKIRSLMDIVFKAIARSMKLEEHIFSNYFGEESLVQARFNFYPACPQSDKILGLKPHTDKSGITVLLQDKQVEGLQLFKDDKWFGVPIIPNALIVNLGDQMEILTNGVLKSPLHRVTTNAERMRTSVAILIEPNADQEIGPVTDFVKENRPKLYKPVKNYGEFNFKCFQKGIVALDEVKI